MSRIIAISLLAAALGLGLGAQTSPDGPDAVKVTEVDILERLEEIDRKVDAMAAGADLRSTERLRIGIVAVSASYSPKDSLDEYVSSFGTYDSFGPVVLPFADGADSLVEYMATPRIGLRLRYSGYAQSSRGLPLFRLDSMYSSELQADANTDGYNDYYSFPHYFTQEVSASIQLHIPLLGEALSVNAGAGAGLGSRRLLFSTRATGYWRDVLGSAEADSLWENRFAILGANLGASVRVKRTILQLSAGVDWNLAVTPWSPAYGIKETAPIPPSGIEPFKIWVGIFPMIVL